ncbi:MAG: hypothetical protein L0H83_15255, partial [Salinisphaera sp.]|nr:hypothetical protein [Salinisphaera sp.]
MGTLRHRFARWVLAHRVAAFIIFGLITVFFALGLPDVRIQTIFDDLLPTDDPFVQVYKDHPNFGNPLTVLIMVQNTDGSIYNAETLQKVWNLSRDIDLAPAVNHDTVLSIAATKARYARATPYGIDMRPLMGDHPPSTPEEIAAFKQHVQMAPKVAKFLISEDGSAAFISAVFIGSRIDYGETFDYLRNMVEDARDAHHKVYLTVKPILIG